MSVVTYVLTFRWARFTSELAGYLSAVALLGATFSIVYGVLLRYFLGEPTIWQTEFSIYLLMFATFVGGAYGVRHHAHVGVGLLVDNLPVRPQLILRLIAAGLSLAVVVIVFWTSAQMWQEAYIGGWTSSTAWRAPLSLVYAILPIGMVLIGCQYIAFVIDGVLGLLGRSALTDVALLKIGNPEVVSEDGLDAPAGAEGRW